MNLFGKLPRPYLPVVLMLVLAFAAVTTWFSYANVKNIVQHDQSLPIAGWVGENNVLGNETVKALLIVNLLAFLIFAGLLTLVLSALVSLYITRPLETLRQQMLKEELQLKELNIDERAQHQVHALVLAFAEVLKRIARKERDYDQQKEQLQAFVQERTHELVLARDEALAADQAKTALIANVSHELRTPLQAIIGYSDIILRRAEEHPNSAEKVNRIMLAARHLLSLIDNILDMSKAESGRTEINYEILSIPELVESLRSNVEPILQDGNTLLVEIAEDISFIRSDATKVRQILLNLLINANKFTSMGAITLRISGLTGGLIQFVVDDTGIGIPEDKIERIFEKFYRIPSASNRGYSGTGIGLSLTNELCKLLGGSVSVESKIGQGARFTVNLPGIVEDSLFPVFQDLSVTQNAPTAPRTVLLAEDDPIVQDVIAEILRSAGHICHVVDGGEQALALLLKRNNGIDLAILDYQMSGLNGLDVLERYHSTDTRHIPVIIITADVTETAKQQFASYRTEFMIKPVMPEELLEKIHWYTSNRATEV